MPKSRHVQHIHCMLSCCNVCSHIATHDGTRGIEKPGGKGPPIEKNHPVSCFHLFFAHLPLQTETCQKEEHPEAGGGSYDCCLPAAKWRVSCLPVIQKSPFRDLALGQYKCSFCIAHQLSNQLARIDVLSSFLLILFKTQLYDYFLSTTLSSGQNLKCLTKEARKKSRNLRAIEKKPISAL